MREESSDVATEHLLGLMRARPGVTPDHVAEARVWLEAGLRREPDEARFRREWSSGESAWRSLCQLAGVRSEYFLRSLAPYLRRTELPRFFAQLFDLLGVPPPDRPACRHECGFCRDVRQQGRLAELRAAAAAAAKSEAEAEEQLQSLLLEQLEQHLEDGGTEADPPALLAAREALSAATEAANEARALAAEVGRATETLSI